MRRNAKFFVIAGIVVMVSLIAYLLVWMIPQWQQITLLYHDPLLRSYLMHTVFSFVKERGIQVLAIAISAILIASTSLVFQTTTQSRILTPSVLGFDAIYALTQSVLIFALGSISFFVNSAFVNFIVNTLVMTGMVLLMYLSVLRKNKNNIMLLLLVGMVVTSLARSGVNLIQVILDPNEYQSFKALTSVSITNINTTLVMYVTPIMLALVCYFFLKSPVYDIMQLGEAEAINLGINYRRQMHTDLILIAVAMAIATALIGPLSFLGLIAVNSAREILKTYKHKQLMVFSSLTAIIFLVLGQVIIELTGYITTVLTLISLFGGIYMIVLIVKEHKG